MSRWALTGWAIRTVPYQPSVDLLLPVPGFDRLTIDVIIAETGADMSRFPSSGLPLSGLRFFSAACSCFERRSSWAVGAGRLRDHPAPLALG